ncbi:prepilin-type N-terminal cleavage/methylation domain-containing protein [bacterium]|nr:prepilin-type N-terminal cleavage/methylation domain-containing protein [bacterium]
MSLYPQSSILNPRKRGFTLLEILVAVAVTGMIMSVIYTSFARTVESKEYIEQGNEIYHKIRWAVDKITSDLSAAYVHPNKESHSLFYGASNIVNDMPMDELHFTTFAYVEVNPMGIGSDQAEVSYKVAWLPDLEQFQLWRREDATVDEDTQTGGEQFVLLDNVLAFNVRFYDGSVWKDQWDSRPFDALFDEDGNPVETQVEQTDEMVKAVPYAVEVTLAVAGPDGRPIVFASKMKLEMSTVDLVEEEEEGADDDDDDASGDPAGGTPGGATPGGANPPGGGGNPGGGFFGIG